MRGVLVTLFDAVAKIFDDPENPTKSKVRMITSVRSWLKLLIKHSLVLGSFTRGLFKRAT